MPVGDKGNYTDRQQASCPQVKTSVNQHRSWGHRWCQSDPQKGGRRALSVINLIPLGYFVLCPEMKQHFDLRTRCQLTVGLWGPWCWKCWVCKPAPSHWNLGDALLASCRNPREEERERKGELKTSLAKSTAAWDFCQLYLCNLLVVA